MYCVIRGIPLPLSKTIEWMEVIQKSAMSDQVTTKLFPISCKVWSQEGDCTNLHIPAYEVRHTIIMSCSRISWKNFFQKNSILLLLLQAFSKPSLFLYFSSLFPHPKKEQKCLTISCFPISFVQKSRQKQRVKYRKAKCYRFRNLFGIVASFLWLIFIMRMTGED